MSQFDLPAINEKMTLIDYTVDLKTGKWQKWLDLVP